MSVCVCVFRGLGEGCVLVRHACVWKWGKGEDSVRSEGMKPSAFSVTERLRGKSRWCLSLSNRPCQRSVLASRIDISSPHSTVCIPWYWFWSSMWSKQNVISVCCSFRWNERNFLQPVLHSHVVQRADFHAQSAPCFAKCTNFCYFNDWQGGAFSWSVNAGLL